MIVTIIVSAAIAVYAVFVIYNLVKKHYNAKKNGGACCGCSAGGCPNCGKHLRE